MNSHYQPIANDLERRFRLIMAARPMDGWAFFSAIADYVSVVERAVKDVPILHMFWHEENERAIKVYHPTPEEQKNGGRLNRNEFCSMCIYAPLQLVAKKIQEGNVVDLPFVNLDVAEEYKNYVKHIHPMVLAKVEEQIALPIEPKQRVPKNAGVYYDPKSGVGVSKKQHFKFMKGKAKFNVFGRLYLQVGEPLQEKDILELGFYNPQKNTPSYFMNELAKAIRKKAHLTSKQLILNNGQMTLFVHKLEEAPR